MQTYHNCSFVSLMKTEKILGHCTKLVGAAPYATHLGVLPMVLLLVLCLPIAHAQKMFVLC